MIPLFDLHCDTLSELYKHNYSFESSPLHISHDKLEAYSPYIQVCAIWSDYHFNDEDAYFEYKNILAYGLKQSLCPLRKSLSQGYILAVEDARILNNDISRLYELYSDGVRILTLNWKGNSCIGGGWDTDSPLTDFGIQVIKECANLGIVVDLSHSSYNVQLQVLKLSELYDVVPIFSHSNSYSVCKHERNLRDDVFRELVNINSIVGISLCPFHLSYGDCDIYQIIKHIEHYFSLGGNSAVCLGCDFDGVDTLPNGISSIKDLYKLHGLITDILGTNVANNIFYKNAYTFFKKHFN